MRENDRQVQVDGRKRDKRLGPKIETLTRSCDTRDKLGKSLGRGK